MSGVGLERPDAVEDAWQDAVDRVLCAAVRLFTTAVPSRSYPSPLRELSPTEACTAAAALLRAQGLTPFEFGIWFSATGSNDVAQ